MENKICLGYCSNCYLFGKLLTDRTKNKEQGTFYNIDYFINNKNKIVQEKEYTNLKLIKLEHDIINIKPLIDCYITKINYYINYKDIEDENILNKIKNNIELICISGISLNLYIICENINEVLYSYKTIKNLFNEDINFYTNFLFDTKKYPELNIKKIIKQDFNNLIDKNICNHFIKDWNFLYEYKR